MFKKIIIILIYLPFKKNSMIKGIEFTKAMDKKLQKYQKDNLLTIQELSKQAWIGQTSIYKFRKRGTISVKSIKKIKENLWVDLLWNNKPKDE